MVIKINDNRDQSKIYIYLYYSSSVVVYVRSTRQYFFYKYHKRLKRKIKTPQLIFINTNQPKIQK